MFLCRSPGGTPVRRRRSKGVPASLSDPAALIAEALKRKFANNRHNVSSDKENSLELSPFGSPETPKVCPLDAPPVLAQICLEQDSFISFKKLQILFPGLTSSSQTELKMA